MSVYLFKTYVANMIYSANDLTAFFFKRSIFYLGLSVFYSYLILKYNLFTSIAIVML